MAKESRKSLESVSHNIDGVAYTIFPTHEKGGFHASWQCQCGASGGSSLLRGTVEDAIAYAQVNLATHHAAIHPTIRVELKGMQTESPQWSQVTSGLRTWSPLGTAPDFRVYIGNRHYSFAELLAKGDGVHPFPAGGPSKYTQPVRK